MIHEIDAASAAQLKSGQVIVELSNALKELVENAIDANSSAVTVKIHNYGLDGIQVTDNGDGIDPSDFEFVARAHSTSKISSFSDLTAVTTLGFRGEALASLCQVAKLTIQTSQGAKGHKLEFKNDGSIAQQTIIASPKGTTVALDDFFGGLPVRRKDLERNYKRKYTDAIRMLQSYAVIWDGTLVIEHILKDGKRSTVLRAQGNDMSDRISLIFGPKTAANILSVDLNGRYVRLVGRISRPAALIKGQRSSTRLVYINGRPVNDRHIIKLVISAFQEYEPHGSPFFALNLLVDPAQLDINVTPDKRDIRLLQSFKVMRDMEELVRQALTDKEVMLERTASIQTEHTLGNSLTRFLGAGPVHDQNGKTSDASQGNSQQSSIYESDNEEMPRKVQRTSQASLRSFTYGTDFSTAAEYERREHIADLDADVRSDGELESEPEPESGSEPQVPVGGPEEELFVESELEMTPNVVPCGYVPVDAIDSEVNTPPLDDNAVEELQSNDMSMDIVPSQNNDIAETRQVIEDDIYPNDVDGADSPGPSQPGETTIADEYTDHTESTLSKSLNCHISLPTTIEDVKAAMSQIPSTKQPKIRNFALDEDSASERLNLIIKKSDFSEMGIIGQFNLGFILVSKKHGPKNDIFIIDQHASDEIYNFERLQKTTVMRRQPLVAARQLELSAVEELTITNNLHVFERNGFSIKVDHDKPPGKQCFITALPYSKGTIFNESDINELVYKVSDSQGDGLDIKCSKLRSMFAMRACRSSIMVGDALSVGAMKRVVTNLGTLDKPWNCPHGRPTLRHITSLG